MNWIKVYLEAIQGGDEVVSQKVRAVYEREVAWMDDPPDEFPFYFDESEGERPIEFIETICCHSKGKWARQPMQLELFQKAKIQLTFGWLEKETGKRRFREVVDLRGRKCGKSTETAAVEWYVLVGDGEGGAEIYCTAKFVGALLSNKQMKTGQNRWRLSSDTKIDQSKPMWYNGFGGVNMTKVSGVYKIINNTDGKVYIGQTVHYYKRIQSHVSHLKAGTHFNEHLQRAWTLYGENSFTFEIIQPCDVEELDNLEKKYIKVNKACDAKHGYNMMHGGQSYRTFTDEVRAKMSKSGVGKKFSEQHKNKISASRMGLRHTNECMQRIAKTKADRKSGAGEKNGNALFSDSIASKIITELMSGEDVKGVSKRNSVPTGSVYNLMYNRTYRHIMPKVRADLVCHAEMMAKKRLEKALEMVRNGYSQNVAAKECGVSRNTIRPLLKSEYANTEVTAGAAP